MAKNKKNSKEFDTDPKESPSIVTYKENFGGVISSFIDRLPFSENLYK